MKTVFSHIASFFAWLSAIFVESAGFVLIVAFMSGALTAIFKWISRKILLRIGIKYFEEIRESNRWIGTHLIQIQQEFRSERTAIYFCKKIDGNKEHFIDLNPVNFENMNLYQYTFETSGFNKTRKRGIAKLPNTLIYQKYSELLELAVKARIPISYLTNDKLDENSNIYTSFIDYNIMGFLIIPLIRKDKFYGFVFLSFSNEIKTPRESKIIRKQEFLKESIGSIITEYLLTINKKFKKAIKHYAETKEDEFQ